VLNIASKINPISILYGFEKIAVDFTHNQQKQQ